MRIAALLYPQALATSITLPMEIMHAAHQMASARDRSAHKIDFHLAAPDRNAVQLTSGVTLQPDTRFDALPELNLLLLPAIWRNPLAAINTMRPWLPLIRSQTAAGATICSVGTGSFLLAEAGLLDGRPATTHWNYFSAFARRYPQVNLKTRHLITQSESIYCVGSVNSIADLMVHIIEQWFGGQVSRAIENQFSPEIRQSFKAAAYQDKTASGHSDEAVAHAQYYLKRHLAVALDMNDVAEAAGVRPRTLHRRFKRATGLSPKAYLQELRMEVARELLRNSNLAVGEIAWQVGLQDASYFGQLFRRHHDMSPVAYRAAVRGKLFHATVD